MELRDVTCKFEGKDDRAFYSFFKAINTKETAISRPTSSLFGNYDKEKNKTKFSWGISENLYEDPSVLLMTTIEDLKQSTVQICIYRDREANRGDISVKSRKSVDSFTDES